MSVHLGRGCRDAAISATSLERRGILSGNMTERGGEMSDQASAAPRAPSAPPTPSDPANNNTEPDVGDPKVEIDEELLIEEVKKFPILYEKAYAEYTETMAKIKAWNKVCQSLFKQWSTFTPRKKKFTLKMVQNKWQKQTDNFFKSYKGVQKRPPAKKPKMNMDSLMFLVPPPVASNMDEVACTSNTNTDAPQIQTANIMTQHPELEMPLQPEPETPLQPGLEIPLQPEPEIPQVHNPGNPPVPSTSEAVYGYARAYEVRQPVYIPMTDPQSANSNMHFALMLVPLLNRLSQNALYIAWPEILNTIKKYEGAKRVQVIGQQVIYEATQTVQENVEFSGVATADVPPEEPVQEEEEEAVQDNIIYPSSYGRPTNPEGEIMYPETDHEDLDYGDATA